MAAPSTRPPGSQRGMCPQHGLAVGPDGRCVLCRRDSKPPAPFSRPPSTAPASSPDESSASGFPIFGVLAVVVLIGGGYYGYLRLQDGSAETVESPIVTPLAESPVPEAVAPSRPLSPATSETPRDQRASAEMAVHVEVRTSSTAPAEGNPSTAAGKTPLTEAEVRRYLAALDVNLYTTSWCQYCRKARAFFSQNGVPYREYDVERDAKAREKKEQLSPGKGVPVVEIEGAVIGGYDPRAYASALEKGVEKASGVPLQFRIQVPE